jgi:hypothetical protein
MAVVDGVVGVVIDKLAGPRANGRGGVWCLVAGGGGRWICGIWL